MSKIFLSVPILERPELHFMYSMYMAVSTSRNHQVIAHYTENDSLISRVRNCHMSEFLFDPRFRECSHFMSIDSDLEIVNCFSNNNIFDKLISHDLDFVGGLYATKNIRSDGVIRSSSVPINSSKEIEFNSGLIEMKWLSAGCWCIKRTAVEKMAESYPELLYDGDDIMYGKKIYGFYIPEIVELEENGIKFKKMLSEDWSYCNRWTKIGGKIFADTSIVLRHYGKKVYNMFNVAVETRQVPSPGFDLKEGEK